MTEGTISVLLAEHNIIHSILVIIAWKKLYGKMPKFWQIVCIFLHDIGYFGRNFMTEKNIENHEILGAKIAKILFNKKGYQFVLGHRSKNKPNSLLEAPDDYSWCIAPIKWLEYCNRLQKQSIPAKIFKISACNRWINRFNGAPPSSMWDDVVKKYYKEQSWREYNGTNNKQITQ
ncbi:MAG: HD domain-containing protein [Promethearchaeota archaeon]